MKHALDMLGAAAPLVVLSPLLAAIAVAAVSAHGRPVLFRQTRLGRGARPFTIHEFRTMRPTREVAHLIDSLRVTWLGRFLRRTSR